MRHFMKLVAVGLVVLLPLGCSKDLPTEAGDGTVAPQEADGTSDVLLSPAEVDPAHGVRAGVVTYEITLENMAPATGPGSSQPFSPPVLATHSRNLHLYHVGSFASDELAQIAEDAVNGPMLSRLHGSHRVFDVVEGTGAVLPGTEDHYEIQAAPGRDWLSLVFMLVNTNDGFGGVDGIRLPNWGEKVYMIRAYDAGSEKNTELSADIPGPCCGSHGVRVPTHERIRYHAGILGGGDLDPAIYGWSEPVAKLTVRRVQPTYQVTLENLTPVTVPGGSQVFSPPVLAVHQPTIEMFHVHRYASPELIRIAEEGDVGPMVDRLTGHRGVFSVVTGPGPVAPGTSATYEIEAPQIFARLSMAFMLVNTNDGFSGIDRVRLPFGGTVAYYLDAYDAGSEQDTERASDIPGPCCGSHDQGPDEHERIRRHPGILGVGDLDPADYGWSDPSAKLTITRIK